MACNNSGVFYWPGAAFSSTNALFTDSNLTTLAPDGLYSIGGVYREVSGGVLGPPTNCPKCAAPCTLPLNASGQGSGKYLVTYNIGPTLGVIVIRFYTSNVADMCTWSYDYDNSGTPTVASEYSSNTWGYLTGFIGNGGASGSQTVNDSFGNVITLDNALGSSGLSAQGNIHDYSPAGAASTAPDFIDTGVATTLGPYTASQVSLRNGSSGFVTMIVPKPNASPTTLDIVIEAPADNTVFGVRASCPVNLNRFFCKAAPAACSLNPTDPFFTSHPSHIQGYSNVVNVGDWVFEDQYAVNKKAAGTYLVNNNGSADCIVVSSDGVVTSITTCTGSC